MNQPNIFLGLLMLVFAIISFDIFLCYTRYMIRYAYLDNFSESFSFAIGPLFYLYIYTSTKGKIRPSQLWHFLPFVLYSIYILLYIVQPTDFKYYAYTSTYFPGLDNKIVYPAFDPDPLLLRANMDALVVLQVLIYIVLSIIKVLRTFKAEKVSVFAKKYKNLSWLRNFTIGLLIILFVFIIVDMKYGSDIGDYLISSCFALLIYGTSINVIRSSDFFTDHLGTAFSGNKKYAKSSLSEEDKVEILRKLKDSMENEKYFKNNMASQSQISRKLLIPAHHISQVINEKLNQSFFEFIASYRIKEAEKILRDPDMNHLTVEEIAEEVGYISKSAFNKTFKKITGKTPSEYRTLC
ncbi:MAG: AraC family transcriptional regulator [Bacteroidales bacterium]|nr:AraC family transcriptional regulator [Bacteroidales bacterium]